MKITFVVPELNLTGGLRVVSIYADLLARKGHTVTVVAPNKKKPNFKERIKSLLKKESYMFNSRSSPGFFENTIYNLKILDECRPVISDDVPDADIIIATFWITAEWVAEFSAEKGKKTYFIQHYEVHPWLPIERVKATFKLPFKQIVVSQWIADTLLSEYGLNKISVVPNGVDLQQFHSKERDKQENTTFGIMYSARSFKGCKIAFTAFEIAKAKNKSIRLIAFGSRRPEPDLPLPDGTKFYLLPKQSELRDIYAACDAWLFSSEAEGFGLPILEAMACRTPVIGTRCGAAPMLIDKTNGFLVDVNDSEVMADAMSAISNMSNESWQGYSLSAYMDARKYRWEDAVDMFEDAFLD